MHPGKVTSIRNGWRLWTLPLGVAALCSGPALAADAGGSTFDIYGFAMLDMGYETKQSDPNWFDAARPTKLPAYDNQYGADGHWYSGVRQSRLGFKSSTPTDLGDLKTIFEFELYGVGVDAGQTTIRLRHAYGELGHFGAGQTWSPFMDIDVFPNSVEYWGPSGMAFYRNVQVRWMPIQGDTRLTIALERPGGGADGGDYADRIQLNGVKARFDVPDLSAEYRYAGGWGYVEAAGILRKMKWDDTVPGVDNLSGSATGWGINLSSNLNVGNAVFRLSVVFGDGIENYMNDAPADIGPKPTGDPTHSIDGKPLPMVGIVAFVDYKWNDSMSTAFGYSSIDIDNSSGQSPNAFKKGEYALANIMFTPVKNVMFGPEVIWLRRENNSDGYKVDDVRIQFSAKYNFGVTFGGK
jgi:DcaP outer membrane protein